MNAERVWDNCPGPRATVFGVDAFPEIDQKAAVPLESPVRNRALIAGNTHIGWLSTVVFYGLHDIEIEAPDDDGYELVIAVASVAITYGEAAAHLQRWH